ncbi:MAG: hypothetical protein FWE07_00835 [Turicibacter sp.]|nr:hypothetical protein [Turicibacter sp.]
MATLTATNANSLNNAVQAAASGDVINVMNNISLDGDGSGFQGTIAVPEIPGVANITIQSSGGPYTISSNTVNQRHFNNSGGLTLQNIVLDGGDSGGGVQVYSTARITDTYLGAGCVVQNCVTTNIGGAGVSILTADAINNGYNGSTANVTLDGCTIQNNHQRTPTVAGGGVWLSGQNVTATMDNTNGETLIDGNTSQWSGGGIVVNSGSILTINNGTISNNKAALHGGGIDTFNGALTTSPPATVIMNNALILDNEAGATVDGVTNPSSSPGGSGGGIAVEEYNNFTMNGGTIQGNTATLDGGGISTMLNANLTINGTWTPSATLPAPPTSGEPCIAYNTAAVNGGGISMGTQSDGSPYLGAATPATATATITKAAIFSNTAHADGGGLHICNAAAATVNGSLIDGNIADNNGGGYYITA